MASQRSRGQPLITPRLCRSRYQISMVARRSITYGLDAILEEWISKLVNKMMVLNAASDLYKKYNKDNIIDNLDFSSCK